MFSAEIETVQQMFVKAVRFEGHSKFASTKSVTVVK